MFHGEAIEIYVLLTQKNIILLFLNILHGENIFKKL
jgi:hypothetical protein